MATVQAGILLGARQLLAKGYTAVGAGTVKLKYQLCQIQASHRPATCRRPTQVTCVAGKHDDEFRNDQYKDRIDNGFRSHPARHPDLIRLPCGRGRQCSWVIFWRPNSRPFLEAGSSMMRLPMGDYLECAEQAGNEARAARGAPSGTIRVSCTSAG